MGSEMKCWLDFNILLIVNHILTFKNNAYLFTPNKTKPVPAELEVLTKNFPKHLVPLSGTR